MPSRSSSDNATAASKRRQRAREAIILGIVTLLGLTGAAVAFFYLDQTVVDLDKQWIEHPAWAVALTIATWLGSWQFAPVIAAVLILAARPHWRRMLRTLAFALIVRAAIVQWMKLVIGRPRPWVVPDATVFEGFGGGRSFPSGHTSFAFMMAIIISGWFPRWRWPVWAVAIFIAVSRVLLSAHYVSDILVGAVIGTLLGAVALWLWPPVTEETREEIEREERERCEARRSRTAEDRAAERRLALRVLTVVLWVAAALMAYWFIDPIPGFFENPFFQHAWVIALAQLGRFLGTWELAPILIAAALIAAGNHWKRLLLTFFVGYAIQTTATELIKDFFGRPRPSQIADPDLFFAPLEIHTSFVSGHASFIFMFATIISAWFPRARIPAFALAVFVIASRVAVAAHYPSDVIFGALLGVLAAWIVLAIWRPPAGDECEAGENT